MRILGVPTQKKIWELEHILYVASKRVTGVTYNLSKLVPLKSEGDTVNNFARTTEMNQEQTGKHGYLMYKGFLSEPYKMYTPLRMKLRSPKKRQVINSCRSESCLLLYSWILAPGSPPGASHCTTRACATEHIQLLLVHVA